MFLAEPDRKNNGIDAHLSAILEIMLEAYANGEPEAIIFVHSEEAYNYVEKWSRGWQRKAGPSGVWKNSKGISFRRHMSQF